MTTMLAVGPFGAAQGILHEMTEDSKILTSITIYSTSNGTGGKIQGLSFKYKNNSGTEETVGPWGKTTGGSTNEIDLTGTYVSKLEGTYDTIAVRSLIVTTTSGDVKGPFGDPVTTGVTGFEIPIHNGAIVGFFANSTSSVLNSVGAYVGPQA